MIVVSSLMRFIRCVRLAHRVRKLTLKTSPQTSRCTALWRSDKCVDVWAHAGGGAVGFLTNSKEAIDDSIMRGYRVIEVDVSITSDRVPVLSHGFAPSGVRSFPEVPDLKAFKSMPICGKFTPLSLREFFERYVDCDLWFALDIPSTEGFDFVKFMADNTSQAFCKRIIYQINSLEELSDTDRLYRTFGAVHYCVGYEILHNYSNLASFANMLASRGVSSVSFGEQTITNRIKYAVKCFSQNGIIVSVARVNSIERARQWMGIGVPCFDSDLIAPGSLQ